MAAVQLVVAAGASALVTVGTREKLLNLRREARRAGRARCAPMARGSRRSHNWCRLARRGLPPCSIRSRAATRRRTSRRSRLTADGCSAWTGPCAGGGRRGGRAAWPSSRRRCSRPRCARGCSRSAACSASCRGLPARPHARHVIDQQFVGLEWAQAAHELMESNANAGKPPRALAGRVRVGSLALLRRREAVPRLDMRCRSQLPPLRRALARGLRRALLHGVAAVLRFSPSTGRRAGR